MNEEQNASAVAKITRIAAGDDRTRYDNAAITLHWLTACFVLVQFGLAQTWGFFDRPVRHTMVATHMSFGVLLAAVIVARIVWRLIPGHQVPSANVGWLEIASKAVHYLLYALLAAEVMLGFAAAWSGKSGTLNFFGILIASPLAPFTHETHHLIEKTHGWVAWTIIVVATLHALAALFHHYVLKDGLISRMLPGQ